MALGRLDQGEGDQVGEAELLAAAGRLEIAIPAAKTRTRPIATIWVLRTLAQGAVNVEQGENRNRVLTYTNVVRDLQRAGEWTGEAMKIDLPVSLGPTKQDGVAVVLQSHDYGEVLGAALMPVQSNYVVVPPH